MKRVILTTGGTGGHIFPALAVAEELKKRYPNVNIVFMGGTRGPEAELAKKAGLDFVGLPVRGMFGRGIKAVGAVFLLGRAILQARKLIRRFKPDFVAGFGGYASAAGVLGGVLAGVPTAVHEQNSVPGMANRVAGFFADRVFIAMPDIRHAFKPAKTRLTGNPVRMSIAALHGKKFRDGKRPVKPDLLVFGGSQGAKAINDAILAILPALSAAGVQVRWQTGQADYARIAAAVKADKEFVEVSPFIHDMAEAYAWASLAVCRAGASTLTELAAAGVPALLIPFPHATHDHQLHNARQAEKDGGAMVIEQKDLKVENLSRLILDLFADVDKLPAMAKAAEDSARLDALADIADELELLSQIGIEHRAKAGVKSGRNKK